MAVTIIYGVEFEYRRKKSCRDRICNYEEAV